MSLKLTDTIFSDRQADTRHVVARLDRPDQKDRDFLAAVTHWCAVAGVDPVVVIAQWLLETDNARSIRWNRDLNASGMGIVSDGTAQPFHIPDVDASARLFVQCLHALVERKRHREIPLWEDGERWFSRVWLPKVESAAMPDVRTVVDLGKRYLDNGDRAQPGRSRTVKFHRTPMARSSFRDFSSFIRKHPIRMTLRFTTLLQERTQWQHSNNSNPRSRRLPSPNDGTGKASTLAPVRRLSDW